MFPVRCQIWFTHVAQVGWFGKFKVRQLSETLASIDTSALKVVMGNCAAHHQLQSKRAGGLQVLPKTPTPTVGPLQLKRLDGSLVLADLGNVSHPGVRPVRPSNVDTKLHAHPLKIPIIKHVW